MPSDALEEWRSIIRTGDFWLYKIEQPAIYFVKAQLSVKYFLNHLYGIDEPEIKIMMSLFANNKLPT
jgi:hypothetical protein